MQHVFRLFCLFWLFTNRKALYLPHYIDKDKIFLGE